MHQIHCCPYCSFQFLLCTISQHICTQKCALCMNLSHSLITLSLKVHKVFVRYAFVLPSSTNKMLSHKRLNALYFSPVVSQFIHHRPHLLCLSACYSLTCNMTSRSGRTQIAWLSSIQTHTLTLCIISIQKLNALLYKIIYAMNHFAHRQKYTVVFCKKKKKKERKSYGFAATCGVNNWNLIWVISFFKTG